MKITAFDGVKVRETREALEAHLKDFAEARGVAFSVSSARYSSTKIGFYVEFVQQVSSGGPALTVPEQEYMLHARVQGLDPDALGKVFVLPEKGWQMRITGYKASRPKFPVKAVRISDGKEYKLPVHMTKKMILSGEVITNAPKKPDKPAPRINLSGPRPHDDW